MCVRARARARARARGRGRGRGCVHMRMFVCAYVREMRRLYVSTCEFRRVTCYYIVNVCTRACVCECCLETDAKLNHAVTAQF